MVSVGGLASGLDTQGIVAQLLELERRPIRQLEAQVAELTAQQGRYTALQPNLNALRSATSALQDRTSLLRPQLNIQGSAVSATVQDSAVSARYDLTVSQLATAGRIASQGVDSTSTPIAVGPGSFQLRAGANGALVSVSVDAATTLNDLASAINAQNGEVTASVINDGTAANAQRLVLSSARTGRDFDVEIVNNDTTLQFDTKLIEDAVADDANDSAYTGTVSSSGTYTGSDSKTFIVEILAGGVAGTATYRVSSDGGITFDDNGGAGFTTSETATPLGAVGEGVDIAFTNSGSLTAGDRFSIDVTVPVLDEAKDAVFRLNGIQQTRSSNDIDDAVEGLSFSLLSTTESGESSSVTVSRNDGAIITALQEYVNAYNEVVSGIRQQQTFDPDTNTAGALLGDPTANRIVRSLRNAITRQAVGVVSGPQRLIDLGISSSTNGEIRLDANRLTTLLEEDREGVLDLLASSGTASVPSLGIESQSGVGAGVYGVSVSTVPERASVSASGVLGTLSADETLSFSLSSDQTDDTPSSRDFTVSLSAGDTAAQVLAEINSAFATQGVAFEAVLDGAGQLELRATEFGADFQITVSSDVAAGVGSTQIGTTELVDAGVDIAGLISGRQAIGVGNTLTGTGDLADLVLSYSGSDTGNIGIITITEGLGSLLADTVEGLVTGSESVLATRNQGLQSRIDRLNEQILAKNEQVARNQARLEREFANLEVTLAQLQSQGNFVTNQLALIAPQS
ncbi:MAG: flagellar filament capping protein FliD [Myxococcota bacterium]